MEFGEMLISTGVDALIKLVREKGKIEITLASRLLNIPIATIEEWAHALEDQGIISIEYQLTKIYLKWLSPTEEKLDAEKAEFTSEKAQLIQQIRIAEETSRERMKDIMSLKDDFGARYSKLMSSIDDIWKRSTESQELRHLSEEDYYKTLDSLEEIRGKLGELRDSMKFMREQFEKSKGELTGSEMEARMKRILEAKDDIEALKAEMAMMETEVSKALDSLSKRGVDFPALQNSIQDFKGEIAALREKMNSEVEGLKEFASAMQVVSDAKAEVQQIREYVKSATAEIGALGGSVAEAQERLSSVSKAMEENLARAAQIKDSLESAELVFSQINSGAQALEKIDVLLSEGKALEQKMESLQASVQDASLMFENMDKLISSLSELRKKVSDERKRLAEESGAIFSSLDEEISTYSTFQKIKEKASHTIDEYVSQLEKIEVAQEKVSADAERLDKRLNEALSRFRESGEYKSVEKLSKDMDSLMEKKKLLEQIKEGIDALEASASKVAKQVKLLSKEAELIDLRSGSPAQALEQVRRKGEEVREIVTLTAKEQQDFDAKRDELRKLIKKLWEEE